MHLGKTLTCGFLSWLVFVGGCLVAPPTTLPDGGGGLETNSNGTVVLSDDVVHIGGEASCAEGERVQVVVDNNTEKWDCVPDLKIDFEFFVFDEDDELELNPSVVLVSDEAVCLPGELAVRDIDLDGDGVWTCEPVATLHGLNCETDEIARATQTSGVTTWSCEDDGLAKLATNCVNDSPVTFIDGAFDCTSGASDRRLKTNLTRIEDALHAVSALRGVTFDYRHDVDGAPRLRKGRQLGLVAQDVEAVLPELVQTNASGFKSVDYAKLSAVLVEAVKEQQAQLAAADRRAEALVRRIERLETASAR